MSEPSQELCCWVVKFPCCQRKPGKLVCWHPHLRATGSHALCLPTPALSWMDRTCWQPALGSLSPFTLQGRHSRVLWLMAICRFWYAVQKSRKETTLFSKHLRVFQAKMQLQNSLCCQFGFCTTSSDSVFAFQQARSHLTALLTEPAGLVLNLHLCVLLPPRGNMIQEVQLQLQNQLTESCKEGKGFTWTSRFLCRRHSTCDLWGAQKLDPCVFSHVDYLL